MVIRKGEACRRGRRDKQKALPPEGAAIRYFCTPLGEMRAAADAAGLYSLRYAQEGQSAADAAPPSGENAAAQALLAQLESELAAYFRGGTEGFAVKLHLAPHSEFCRAAWLALRSVPRGQTRSYAEQAALLGKGRAHSRAVAAANGRNPFAVILPCHRIIGANGSLTGYNGGLWRKAFLLRLEGAAV